jgi:regulator of sigma E protease
MNLFSEILFICGGILFAFVAIGFCIFSHELGHFIAARLCGLHVNAFALGFRPFWRKKYKGVEYRLGYLPFGGYCDIPQVEPDPKAEDGTPLEPAKPYARVITAFAGPFFNIISGLIIACFVWWFGVPQDSPKMRSFVVLDVEANSPEYQAGLRPADRIVKLNGKTFFCTWSEFVKELMFTLDDVVLDVERDGKTVSVAYKPQINPNAPEKLKIEGVPWPFFKVLIPIELTPEPGSVAEKAGIQSGDILTAIDGQPIIDYHDFQRALNLAGANQVELALLRKGKPVSITLVPEPVPGVSGAEFELFLCGVIITPDSNGSGVVVRNLQNNFPAHLAGIKIGDKLLAINDEECKNPDEFIARVAELRDQEFKITAQRGDEKIDFTLKARKITPHHIGVSLELRDYPNPLQQFFNTLSVSWKSLRNIAVAVGNKLHLTETQSTLSPRHMSGPLGMGMVLFSMVRYSSLMSGIYFTVMISFALAIFNLMPLPVLDGGHIFFGIIEMIIRKPLSQSFVTILCNIFVVLLIALMIYVTFFDIRRIYYSFVSLPETKVSESSAPQQNSRSDAPQQNGEVENTAPSQP